MPLQAGAMVLGAILGLLGGGATMAALLLLSLSGKIRGWHPARGAGRG